MYVLAQSLSTAILFMTEHNLSTQARNVDIANRLAFNHLTSEESMYQNMTQDTTTAILCKTKVVDWDSAFPDREQLTNRKPHYDKSVIVVYVATYSRREQDR